MPDICTSCGTTLSPGQEAYLHEEKVICPPCSRSIDTLHLLTTLKKDLARYTPPSRAPSPPKSPTTGSSASSAPSRNPSAGSASPLA